jgi:hypothetical protein
MADVGVWQPNVHGVTLSAAVVARLARAAESLDAPAFGLSPDEVVSMATVMRHPASDWAPLLGDQPDQVLVQLVRFFTLAEMQLAGWEALARSPVIPIVAELRRRKSYPNELTAWIKAHTNNRFLPYGSLLDRL